VLLSALAAAVWLYWKKPKGKVPEIPKWVFFWRNEATNNPPHKHHTERTNVVVVVPKSNTPPAALPETNLLVHATNAPNAREEPPEHEVRSFRNVRNALDAQIALGRKGISVGPIDGANGVNMRRALLAWQVHNNLPVSGELDAESKAALLVEEPLFIQYTVSEADLRRIMHIPATWLGKSEVDRLDYESILELVAEKGRASMDFVKRLNPQVNWESVTPGTLIKIPRIEQPVALERAAFVRVHLYSKTLDVFGAKTNLLAHYPCSIAAKVEKRPVGTLHVLKAALNPTYLFDPEVFAESPEAKKISRKLKIPAGPNNPVGTAWIGLDKPGYGIHGTPKPEMVGRTESHGCFRLANWNAEHLLQLAWVGMPVLVEQ
jgi:lipoprotein-anchoring transpeptidase ErfK/SrfK